MPRTNTTPRTTDEDVRTHDPPASKTTRVRKAEPTKTSAPQSEHEDHQTLTCPDCGGDLRVDDTHGETWCPDCGRVVAEDAIDHGPDWRAYTASERDSKARTGSPRTFTQHDKGLTTQLSWAQTDATGTPISSNKRRTLNRLRKWQERARTGEPKERGKKAMLSEIQRLVAALGLSKADHEIAAAICHRASDQDLVPGRSYESIAAGAVYAAIRQAGHPQTLADLSHVSRLTEKQRLARTYRYLVRELDLQIPPPDPHDYLPKIASALDLSQETQRLAHDVVTAAVDAGLHSGKDPSGIAAASIYVACRHPETPADDDPTQTALSDIADVSEVTIRNRYQEIESHCLPLTTS